jgi:molecular chaperone GrpE
MTKRSSTPSSPVSDDNPQSPAPTTVEEPAQEGAEREELAEQLARMEDRYRRGLADLDNLRKRTAREVERRIEESRESLLRDWLEAVDSVERALSMTPEGPVQEGLLQVLAQMEAILTRHGVQRIGQVGQPFDPELHEAVAVRDDAEAPDRTILQVVRSGYVIGDRVLRPAQVVVSRRPEPEA